MRMYVPYPTGGDSHVLDTSWGLVRSSMLDQRGLWKAMLKEVEALQDLNNLPDESQGHHYFIKGEYFYGVTIYNKYFSPS